MLARVLGKYSPVDAHCTGDKMDGLAGMYGVKVVSITSALALLMAQMGATPALADQAFHTLKAPLSAVGNAPLHSGWDMPAWMSS